MLPFDKSGALGTLAFLEAKSNAGVWSLDFGTRKMWWSDGFFALLGYQCFMWFKTGSWPSYELRMLWGSKPVLVYWLGTPWFADWLEQTPLSLWVLLLGLALMVGGILLGAGAQRTRK